MFASECSAQKIPTGGKLFTFGKATLCQTKTGAISPTGDRELERNMEPLPRIVFCNYCFFFIFFVKNNTGMSPKFRSIAVANAGARGSVMYLVIFICLCKLHVHDVCAAFDFETISTFNSSKRGSLPTTSHTRCIAGGAYPGRHQCIMLCFFFANYICLKHLKTVCSSPRAVCCSSWLHIASIAHSPVT